MDPKEWLKKQIARHRTLAIIVGFLGLLLSALAVIDTLRVLSDIPSLPWLGIFAAVSLLFLSICISIAQDGRGHYSFRLRLVARILAIPLVWFMAVLSWRQLHRVFSFDLQQWEWANYGLFLLILSVVIWFFWASLRDSRPSPTIKIVVCEFSEGARKEMPVDRTITQKVLENLRDKASTDRVQIIHHEDVLVENEDAMLLGKNAKASAVLFGYYSKNPGSIVLNLRFQVIKQPKFELQLKHSQKTMPFEDLDRGELQLFLGRDYTAIVLFFVGLFEYSEENYTEALSYFQSALDEVGNDDHLSRNFTLPRHTTHLYMGNCYVYDEQYDEAETAFKSALAYEPRFSKALHNLGVIHYGQQKFEEAHKDFNQAIESDPNMLLAYRNRAFARAMIGKFEEALTDVERYLSDQPDDIQALDLSARCLSAKGEFVLAAEKYKAILAADRTSQWAQLEIGKAYLNAGKEEIAIALLKRLAATNSKYAIPAYLEIAEHQKRLGDCAEALEYYNMAIGRAPRDPSLLMARSALHYQCGAFLEAEQDLTQVLHSSPDNATALFRRGKTRFELGRYEEARDDFDGFVNVGPEHEKHMGYAARAMVELKQKRYSAAVPHFEEAIRHTGDVAQYETALAKTHLACAYDLMSNETNVNEAVLHLREVKRLDEAVWAVALGETVFHQPITEILSANE